MDTKVCPRCPTRLPLPLSAFGTRLDGRPYAYCRACCRENERASRAKRQQLPVHVADPLNLFLRDMPGFRSSLLGIAEAA